MIDYTRPTEFMLDRISLDHDGVRYCGRGLLTWHPENGIHVQAFLRNSLPEWTALRDAGTIHVEDSKDTRTIRMTGRGFGHAVIPNAFPSDLQSCLTEGRLSLHPERIIFFETFPSRASSADCRDTWSGSAVFITRTDPEFPDTLKTETTLNGHPVEAHSRGGLCFEKSDGSSVWGRQIADGLFALSWALPRATASKTQSWYWAEAARRSLSILFAQTVWPIRVVTKRGTIEITELRPRKEVHSLSHSHKPITDFGSPDQWKFNRAAFVHLTPFFAARSPNADVCWSIFCRLAEASRQQTWESRELLTATTLEATLRTLDNHSFSHGDYSWKIKQSLEAFRQKYLGPGWEPACDKALHARDRLRHRNAHPDWITHPGGSFSKQEWQQSIEDLTFLSRFYGFIILALSGFKPLRPQFPVVQFK